MIIITIIKWDWKPYAFLYYILLSTFYFYVPTRNRYTIEMTSNLFKMLNLTILLHLYALYYYYKLYDIIMPHNILYIHIGAVITTLYFGEQLNCNLGSFRGSSKCYVYMFIVTIL